MVYTWCSLRKNAHPQFDCQQHISLVHNGIIENYSSIKSELLKSNHKFISDTDTEAVAHLLEDLLKTNQNIKAAVIKMLSQLQGAFAIAALIKEFPDFILAIRKKSPLCIGVGQNEMFVSSDPLAFAGFVDKVIFLPDSTFAFVFKDKVEIFDFDGNPVVLKPQEYTAQWITDGKQGHEHYMLKEIYEQKRVIQKTVQGFKDIKKWDKTNLSKEEIKNLESIDFIACGTSYHAGKIGKFFIENICKIPARSNLASEFRYETFFDKKNSCYIAISQSGETADTLESIRFLNEKSQKVIALTNVATSSMVRESSGHLLMEAGPEVAVASTKAFTAQLSSLYLLAHYFAFHKNLISVAYLELAQEDLLLVAEIFESCIEDYKTEIINNLAPKYASYKQAIFLGRDVSYPLAQEAALKLKEISYIFTDCLPAGELKHGSLALIDSNTPVFLFSVLDPIIYKKIVSAAQEIKSRSGHLVVFAFEGQDELIAIADYAFIFPKVKPLLGVIVMTGVMQFFVYQIAKVLGRPIDKPRNLAKSVTVE